MSELFDDEFKQMNEREFEKDMVIKEAVSITDPIQTLEKQPMHKVKLGTSIAKIITKFQEKHTACVLVTSSDGKLEGIFTERDIIRKLVGKGLNHKAELVDNYMTPNPDTLLMNDPIAFALNRMYDGGYRHVPIVDENNVPVGLVSILDIVSHLAKYYSDAILNLPPDPMRKAQARPEGG
jgi:CBS domain-containing protein|tara:strand:+ start:16985 stop:17524 length:540 start_codon:yes stop_codon:yes gene_type:complete